MSEKSELISRLKTKKKSRDSYTRAVLSVLIPSQIRALRFRNKLTQKALAQEAEMRQSRISTVERPGAAQLNVETLIRLASAFKVGLKVEFVPFSEMLRWENEFSQDAFNPITIDKDSEFIGQAAATIAVDDVFDPGIIDVPSRQGWVVDTRFSARPVWRGSQNVQGQTTRDVVLTRGDLANTVMYRTTLHDVGLSGVNVNQHFMLIAPESENQVFEGGPLFDERHASEGRP